MAKILRPRLGLCHGTQTRFRRPLMQVFIISILNSPYWSLRNVSTDVTKKNKMRCECKRPCSSFLLFSFSHCEQAIHSIERSWDTDEVEIFLEEREVAFLSPIKICWVIRMQPLSVLKLLLLYLVMLLILWDTQNESSTGQVTPDQNETYWSRQFLHISM